jgi:hypothetical protein
MNMKKTIGLMAVGCGLWAGSADAGLVIDPYIGATAGFGRSALYIDRDSNGRTGRSYGAVLGIDIPLLRVEGEYNYFNANELDAHAGMLNAYLKMPAVVVIPYVGAGVGTIFSGKTEGINFTTGAAYQGMLGLTFDIPMAPVKIDVEGRALYAPDVFEFAGQKPDFVHYELRGKLRLIF